MSPGRAGGLRGGNTPEGVGRAAVTAPGAWHHVERASGRRGCRQAERGRGDDADLRAAVGIAQRHPHFVGRVGRKEEDAARERVCAVQLHAHERQRARPGRASLQAVRDRRGRVGVRITANVPLDSDGVNGRGPVDRRGRGGNLGVDRGNGAENEEKDEKSSQADGSVHDPSQDPVTKGTIAGTRSTEGTQAPIRPRLIDASDGVASVRGRACRDLSAYDAQEPGTTRSSAARNTRGDVSSRTRL